MMIRHLFITWLLMACCPLVATAQGVVFVDKMLDEALALAKKEGKMVFVDCYGTYCPPCKKMLVEEFPKKEMGDYLNKGFISVKYNLDNEPYKKLSKQWEVSMYPTFVFLNSDGELLYRMVGFREADKFIAEAKKGIAENKIGKLVSQYKGGDRSWGFMTTYLKELERMRMREDAHKIAMEILAVPTTDLTTNAEAFDIFSRYVENPYDEVFLRANSQRDALVKAYGEKAAKKIDDVWMNYSGHFAIVDGADFKGYDWDKVHEYQEFMRQHGVRNPEQVEKSLRESWEQYQEMMKKMQKQQPL
ncbi:MAG: thioredoxin fold domain-containing protein [Prevotella sp.]|nr:thioredoxin fold domain-containing protein [Prevotella sp.]